MPPLSGNVYFCIRMMHKILHRLKNKYVFTLLIFLIWMLFFDPHSFISQVKLNRTLHEMEMEKEYYLTEIERDRQKAYELVTDTLTLEKFGREQYLMKRDNEDIYLIVDEED